MRQSCYVLTLLLLCSAIVLACNQSPQSLSVAAPTQPTQIAEGTISPPISTHGVSPSSVPRYYGPDSLEERIVSSDTIAIARLNSVLVGAAYYREFDGTPFYKPLIQVNYDAIEYLKGRGSNDLVAAFDFSNWYAYESEKSVLEKAWGTANVWIGRNGELMHEDFNCGEPPFDKLRTTGSCNGTLDLSDVHWRNDESIIFLTKDEPQRGEMTETEQSNQFTYGSWMSSVSSGNDSGSSSTEQRFAITEYPTHPTKTPLYIFTLSDVRKLITEIDALLKSGEDIPGYKDCLSWMYYKKRVADWDAEHYGRTYTADEVEELREWIKDEGCAEAMDAVGLFENLGN